MTNEEPTPEQKEELRQGSLKNLDSTLWNYAAPKLVTAGQYGKLGELAEKIYPQLISQAPEQDIYQKLFLPQLAKEGGAITSPYLQGMSTKILQQSILSLKTEDVYALTGMKKPMKESYKGKYVCELPEEEIEKLIAHYMSFKTSDIAKGLIDMNKQGNKNGLEEILCEEEQVQEQAA